MVAVALQGERSKSPDKAEICVGLEKRQSHIFTL